MWTETGRYFNELNPDMSQVPVTAGLDDWFDAVFKATERLDDKLNVVATLSGEIVGLLIASLLEPAADTSRQVERDLGRRRIHVDAIAVAEDSRRHGVGTALMEAAHDWGRRSGAQLVLLETEANNDAALTFYHEKLGYTTRLVTLRNDLDD